MKLTTIGIIAFILFFVVLNFARVTLRDIMQDRNERKEQKDEV